MEWVTLLVVAPAMLIPLVILFGFAGCSARLSPGPLLPPVVTLATPVDERTIRLEWTNPNSSTVRFDILRTPEGPGPPPADNQQSPFIDQQLTPGVTYAYRVRAIRLSDGEVTTRRSRRPCRRRGAFIMNSPPTSACSPSARIDAPRQNTLVYLADWRPDAPLREFAAALSRIERCPPGLALIIVVPVGTFAERRRELEANVAPLGARFAAHVHITEDDERGWTRTIAPSSVPAVFLVNARRQLVWKQDGTPGGDELGAALTRFVDPAPPLVATPLRLAVGIGERAPDALFHEEQPPGCHPPIPGTSRVAQLLARVVDAVIA